MINPSRAYPNGVSNLMILSARGDLETILSFSLDSEMVRQADQWGYSALDYAQPGVKLYLWSVGKKITLPFGKNTGDATINWGNWNKCKDYPNEQILCGHYLEISEETDQMMESPIARNSCSEIYQKARWRGISTGWSVSRVCQAINQLLPPPEWQIQCQQLIQNLQFGPTGSQNLQLAERKLLYRYLDIWHYQMNETLREDPKADAPLNRLIERAPPLPHDILVFRGFDHETYPDRGLFIHYGYLSTSITEFFGPEGNSPRLLRMIVPQGTRCLYIGSSEYEVLLPHGSIISILTVRQVTVTDTGRIYQVYDALFQGVQK